MNYDENHSSNQRKFSTGLIVTIALALLLVAGAAWFALSRYNSGNSMGDTISKIESDMGSLYSEMESDINSVTSDIVSDFNLVTSDITSRIESEYDDNNSSYNDIVSETPSNISNPDSMAPTGDDVSSVPYNITVFKMPVEGKIIKDFSATELQYSKTFGDMRLHGGIDISCKKGTAVSSCSDGRVLTIEDSSLYGKVITIDHGKGLTARYSALDNIKVKEGDTVDTGDIIGTVTTVPAECNDEEHLHFEVFKGGVAVSPLKELGLD